MNVDIFACMYIFANLRKLTISRGFLTILPLNDMIKVIFTLYIFRGHFKNTNNAKICTTRKFLRPQ